MPLLKEIIEIRKEIENVIFLIVLILRVVQRPATVTETFLKLFLFHTQV